MIRTIELDCAPGCPRPGDLIDDVIKDTGLVAQEAVSKVFGNWTWEFEEEDDAKWDDIGKIVGPRIKSLCEKNTIRYGSW